MIELELPSTNLVEVPFKPNMPARKGGPKQVPPLEKRVLIGTPLILQLNKKAVGKDLELLGFLDRERDKFRYYLVRVSVSLEPYKKEAFQMVTLNVTLDSPAVNGNQQPIAWSMQPMHDMDTVKYTDTAEISANVQLISAKLGGGLRRPIGFSHLPSLAGFPARSWGASVCVSSSSVA